MTILVTGSAGFIGYHVSKKLIRSGFEVVGYDSVNDYYEVSLKEARLKDLNISSQIYGTKFNFIRNDLSNKDDLKNTFEKFNPRKVINLAAQAGVRHSLTNPDSYIQSNLVGFANLLECCRETKVDNLIYASSSSVYGGNKDMPFKETKGVDHPVSLYAATKRSNELMAHCYSHLFDIPVIGLRFFTVYGPWGRPDMALFLFTKAILQEEPIEIFNHGNMVRDFTYIDDIVESIFRLIKKPAHPNDNFDTKNPDPSSSWCSHRIFNIGNSSPIKLNEYIEAIELELDKKAIKKFVPIQPGDVTASSADTSLLEEWIDFKPRTTVRDGISEFIKWYRNFYKV